MRSRSSSLPLSAFFFSASILNSAGGYQENKHIKFFYGFNESAMCESYILTIGVKDLEPLHILDTHALRKLDRIPSDEELLTSKDTTNL